MPTSSPTLVLSRSALLAAMLAACHTEPPGLEGSAPPVAPSAVSPAASSVAAPSTSAAPRPPSPAAPPATAAAPLSAARVAAARGITLVSAESATPAAADDVPLVILTKSELLVGSDHVADVIPGPLGFDASIKRQGQRSALQLLPLDALLRPIHARDRAQTTVRFLFDATTSYRTALEVIFTAAHAGFTSFDFVVASTHGERALPASTPGQAEWDAAHTAGSVPPPTFTLESAGLSLAVGNDTIGAGCRRGAGGLAVPSLDPEKVAACGALLRRMDPAWAGMKVANISAEGGLDLQTVLSVVAALETTFPTIHFGLLSG